MKRQFVYDPLISKRQQYLLATQVRVSAIVAGFHRRYGLTYNSFFLAGQGNFENRFVLVRAYLQE